MSADNTENRIPPPPRYADEVLYADWNPLVGLPAEPLVQVHKSSFDGNDVEGFLARLYICQQV